MARIIMPRELMTPDGTGRGLWHMTVASDEESWPAHAIGYCRDACPGHDTPEGAMEHFDDWQADTATRHEQPDEQHKCAVCGVQTNVYLSGGGDSFVWEWLCDSHANARDLREVLRRQAPATPPGDPSDG